MTETQEPSKVEPLGLDERFVALIGIAPADIALAARPTVRALHSALLAQPRVFDLFPRLARTDQSNNYRPRPFATDTLEQADSDALRAFDDAMRARVAALETDALMAGVQFFADCRLSALSGAVVCEAFRRIRALESPDVARALLGMPDKHAFENAEIERMTNTSAGEVLEVEALNAALLRENETHPPAAGADSPSPAADADGEPLPPLRAALYKHSPRGEPHQRFTVAVLRAMQDARVDTRALLAQ